MATSGMEIHEKILKDVAFRQMVFADPAKALSGEGLQGKDLAAAIAFIDMAKKSPDFEKVMGDLKGVEAALF